MAMANKNEIPIADPMGVSPQGMDRAYAAGPGPAARTMIGTLIGDRRPITEKDFGPSELDLLAKAVRKAEKAGRSYIGYGDYGESDPWAQGSGAAINALTQLPASLAYTLGMANFKRRPDGSIEITDSYDFGAPRQESERRTAENGGLIGAMTSGFMANGLLGVGNVLGNAVAPQGEGRAVSIKLHPSSLMRAISGK